MTDEQREIMRHALGLNRGSRDYRNHFVTGPGSTDYPHCEALVAAGLMAKRAGNPLSGCDDIYSVTDAGRAALKAHNAIGQGSAACGRSRLTAGFDDTRPLRRENMKFEIINPSDACTMYAPDLEVAAVAVSFLGDGKYPLEGLDDAAGQGVPAFLFGGHDEWFSSKFGMTFQDTAEHVLNNRNEELATTLDSVTLRGTRSSMNDIAGRARSLAQAVRRKVSPNA